MAIDYGPLIGFVGVWTGDQGMDVAPEPDEDEHSAYYERLIFEPAGDVDNADSQEIVMLRYNQTVMRKRNDEVFHNEAGFLSWDAERALIMQSFAIPRGLALVAGGTAESADGVVLISLEAAAEDPQWSISQSPFLTEKARTSRFTRTYRLEGDTLTYEQTTSLEIYGRKMAHTDTNILTRS
ncbi:MAG: heme-binding beta-barrel domain-containing protein [Gammaproteobacteria bacterium]